MKRSPDVAPFLMELHDAQKMYGLAKAKSPEARKLLSDAVCGILNMKVSQRETELVADILIELMRQAEVDFRQALAEQLAAMENVPLRLILQLANDRIEVARPVLQKSDVLGEFDLLYIIKSKTAEYWQEIARRKVLSESVINTLADTGDFETALALVENMDIMLTQHAVVALSDLAQGSDILSVPLLRREEITADVAERLYEHVSQDIRDFIAKNYEIDPSVIDRAVEHVRQESVDNAKPVSGGGALRPQDYMMDAARAFRDKGMLNTKLMLRTLRRGHLRSFTAQFAVYAELPVQTVEEIIHQGTGQKLAVACRAFDIEKADFISIFLLSSKIRDGGRLVNTEEMARAVQYYNKAEKDIATQIIRGLVKH